MKKIWKIPLHQADENIVSMPFNSELLSIQMQGGRPCMWILVDTSDVMGLFSLCMYGTGQDLPDNPGEYLATVQLDNGEVYHVFQSEPPTPYNPPQSATEGEDVSGG